MKNIYNVGAYQTNPIEFRMDVFYEDPGKGQKRFLPDTRVKGLPLISVFNLDRLNLTGDPQPDGTFDFVENVTINSKTGRVMFPVLEPFGQYLVDKIGDTLQAKRYTYPQLYRTTITRAREFPELNRFTLSGSYKSNVSSEISLGAFNIPPGSVRVTAGGSVLIENVDYRIDYGLGRLTILNDAYLGSGVPVNVNFEDNSLFGFQNKSMVGIRADYELSKEIIIGGTFLSLKERPFTQKVNLGDDPLNNKIYGLDINFSKEAAWLTRWIDKLPVIQTKEPSKVSFTSEVAYIQPGHSKFINNSGDKGGVAYVDDFEGSTSSFDLRNPTNEWSISSVPQNDKSNSNPLFPEASLNDNLVEGANRAMFNWYRPEVNTVNQVDQMDPYTRVISITEVFPNRTNLVGGFTSGLFTMDLVYNPNKRGPYNYEKPEGSPFSKGLNQDGTLKNPETRWAGIQRSLSNSDFEAQNYEFIEFYMLSPFLDRPVNEKNTSNGKIFINLGNISEDVLKDGRNSFENGLPGPNDTNQKVFETKWARVPGTNQFIDAFDTDESKRQAQDVGLDGLNNVQEQAFFTDYLNSINASTLITSAKLEIANDPSNDDFVHYREYPNSSRILTRYEKFNGLEGNSKPNTSTSQLSNSATNYPDNEDLNNDNTLNESEAYYQYEIPIEFDGEDGIKLNNYITDKIEFQRNNHTDIWYRFKVPINQPSQVVGDISDFRSIRFMRMYVKDFEDTTILRLARLDLVRNQWRKNTRPISGPTNEPVIITPNPSGLSFDLNSVNFEDNASKIPVNYVLPQGIQLERAVGVNQNAYQNEQALSLSFCNLPENHRIGIFKNTTIDMRYYERIKMFVHAAAKSKAQLIPDGELSLFIRLGSDFTDNFYEYEIPLKMVDFDMLDALKGQIVPYSNLVWDEVNKLDLPLSLLSDLKQERNSAGFSLGDFYTINDPSKLQNKVSVKGNPNLGYVKGIMIGIKNKENGTPRCGEVWINELRLTGFNERSGVAALGRVDFQMADFGTLTLSGNFSSLGWGGLDKRLQERSLNTSYMYDLSTNLELGKFIPGKTGVKVPFYFQYTTNVKLPEYDPYDLDIKLRDKLSVNSGSSKDSIRKQAIDYQNIVSYSFNNVRKERVNKVSKPMPWDVENISVSYGHTKTSYTTPIIEKDEKNQYKGGLDYSYNLNPLYISPFKKIIKNDKYLKFISEFHVNPLPNRYSFGMILDRQKQEKLYRFTIPEFSTYTTRSFIWERNYGLNWDFTRSLKFDFTSNNSSVIDELSIRDNDGQINSRYSDFRNKDTIWTGIKNFGRTKTYRHNFNITYNIPLKNFPLLDWVNLKATYGGSYTWNAAALNLDTLGNVIQNSNTRQLGGDFSFDRLYAKWPYLKKIEKPFAIKDDKKKNGKNALQQDDKNPVLTGSGGKNPKPGSKNATPNSDLNNMGGKGGEKNSGKGGIGEPGQTDSTSLTLSGKSKEEKEKAKKKRMDREPSFAEKLLIRPLLMVRKVRLDYNETFNSTVPGYEPKTELFGFENWNSPGLPFIAGVQPDSRWFSNASKAGEQSWITRNIYQNQLLQKNRNLTLDGRVSLEPFRDFRVELNATKNYTEAHTELYKVIEQGQDFGHYSQRDVGSYTVSYFSMNTIFKNLNSVFNNFENNRAIISSRLGVGSHATDPGFTEGYGRIQQDVLIPAFLSAYSDSDPLTQDLNIFKTKPKINWTLNYNGLTKIDFFKKYFTTISLTHAYKSTLTVNSFNTSPNFDSNDPSKFNQITSNYFSRFEIPDVSITEGLSPLIRLDIRTTNDIILNVDYKKLRNLSLSFIDNKVNENKTTSLTVGAGYEIHNVKLPFMKEFKANKKKKSKKEKAADKSKTSASATAQGGGKKPISQNDLTFKFDLTWSDNNTLSHLIDQESTQTSRGATTLRISPNIDYEYNKNLTLRLYYDYNLTKPKTLQQFKTITQNGGITFRILLGN